MKKYVFLFIVLSLLAGRMDIVAQTRAIAVSGQIIGEDGNPVAGATAILAGTSSGVVADQNGKYSLRAGEDDVIIFSCLGYTETREKVGNRKQINVVLKFDNTILNEAVAIGYGTVRKSDLTGAVGVVDMDKLAAPAISSIDEALQGRIAGVDIISGGGEPGEGGSIRIRGTRSISASNDPLIVVDGVIDAVENFSDINPDDVGSVTVLKDASSTAIYGSRGSNGVILVTTKGGKDAKLTINLNASAKVSMLAKKLDLMDATQFAQFRNDHKMLSGSAQETSPLNSDFYSFGNPAALGTGTDWQGALTRTAISQTYKLSISQGSSKQHMFFSLGYDNTQGIVVGSDMQRVTSMLKVDKRFFKWFQAGANINFSIRHNDVNKVKINGVSNSAAVILSPKIGVTDTWNRYADESDSGGSIFNNPYIKAREETEYKDYMNLVLSPFVKFRIAKGLTLKSTYSYYENQMEYFYYSPASMPLATWRKLGGTATRSDTRKMTSLSETTLNWKRTLKKIHKFDLLAGFTAQTISTDYKYTSGVGYFDDNVGPYNLAAIQDKRALTENSYLKKLTRLSALARGNYSYGSRYFFTLTFRADGSSNFAEGHKWGFFPAGAFKWSLINESWMSSAKAGGLSDLSLRLSAGRSGNDSVGSYVSQAVLSTTSGNWIFDNIQGLSAYPQRLDNTDLTWEKTDSYNAGLDISLFNDRITMTADSYLNYTSDLLLTVQNAAQSGYTSRYANVGSTRGWGVEFSISSRNISKKNFVWSTDFNISHDKSWVTDIGNDYEYISTYTNGGQMLFGYMKGYSANALWGYKFAGVWHTDEEMAQNKFTKQYVSYENTKGFSKYYDVNHDGILNKNDMVYLGSSDPLLYGGMQNTFKFKNLEFGFYLTYSIGGKIYNISEFYLGSGSKVGNKYAYMIDGWHPYRNPESNVPAAYSKDGYWSDRYVHDASYLRMKSAKLSYKLDLSHKIKWLRDITFTLSGDNLFLLAGYNGFDPDVTSSKSVRRLDDSSYPNPRSVVFTVKFRY